MKTVFGLMLIFLSQLLRHCERLNDVQLGVAISHAVLGIASPQKHAPRNDVVMVWRNYKPLSNAYCVNFQNDLRHSKIRDIHVSKSLATQPKNSRILNT